MTSLVTLQYLIRTKNTPFKLVSSQSFSSGHCSDIGVSEKLARCHQFIRRGLFNVSCVTPKILDDGTMNDSQAAWCWSLMQCQIEVPNRILSKVQKSFWSCTHVNSCQSYILYISTYFIEYFVQCNS